MARAITYALISTRPGFATARCVGRGAFDALPAAPYSHAMETSKRRAISLAAIIAVAFVISNGPARADGLPRQAYPLSSQPSQSCLMTALQMGYLTGQ